MFMYDREGHLYMSGSSSWIYIGNAKIEGHLPYYNVSKTEDPNFWVSIEGLRKIREVRVVNKDKIPEPSKRIDPHQGVKIEENLTVENIKDDQVYTKVTKNSKNGIDI